MIERTLVSQGTEPHAFPERRPAGATTSEVLVVRAVVFDIGGVLEITPDTGWRDRWADQLGMSVEDLEARIFQPARQGSLGHIAYDRFVAEVEDALELDEQQVGAFMQDIWDEYLGTLNEELLAYFSALRPRVKTGILSNSFVGAREREQASYGFADHCDTIVYSHEEGMMKPDPAFYAVVCERLDVRADEVVFLDDREVCVEGARAVGMHALLYGGSDSAIAANNRSAIAANNRSAIAANNRSAIAAIDATLAQAGIETP
jgi:epoxide hydrolase-like predicted phosphatase